MVETSFICSRSSGEITDKIVLFCCTFNFLVIFKGGRFFFTFYFTDPKTGLGSG